MKSPLNGQIINALSVDVEEYFHVSAFNPWIRKEEWERYPSRVEDSTRKLLDLFDSAGARGTFFFLGWVARRHPGLVKDVAERGHEIASHGYAHELIYQIGRERFLHDVSLSKALLEDITGERVVGYRAPSYSITRKSLWALDILSEIGFEYDSSIFPIRHDIYGIPDARRFPFMYRGESGSIIEFPMSTVRFGNINLPTSGGGYLRLLPLTILKSGIRYLNRRAEQPAILYIHPWEIDPGQPRFSFSLKSRFRHYLNLGTAIYKINSLLSDFIFRSVWEVLEYSRNELDQHETI